MKKVFIIICLMVVSLQILAENSAQKLSSGQAFVDAPDEVFPTLAQDTRLDMIDYFDCGYNRPSIDIFEDSCIITHKDSLEVVLNVGKSQSHQLALLADDLILLISTYATPMLYSDLRVFDKDWSLQPIEHYITLPTLNDWLTAEGKKNRIDVENMFPFIAIKCDFDVSNGELMITNTMQEYFDKDTWQRVSQWIKPQLKYVWTGKKFKKQ